MSETDAELILRAQVTQDQLTAPGGAPAELSGGRQAAKDELAQQKAVIDATFAEAQALVHKFAAEVAAERPRPPPSTGWPASAPSSRARRCRPARGRAPSLLDDFGQPRSGGRTHQGNDMLAPSGPPWSPRSRGRSQATSNSLGGLSAFVYGDRGDMTYYAHLYGYSGIASGSHVSRRHPVSATSAPRATPPGGPPHLHFEYHPGGGGAVDPYPYLNAVC